MGFYPTEHGNFGVDAMNIHFRVTREEGLARFLSK